MAASAALETMATMATRVTIRVSGRRAACATLQVANGTIRRRSASRRRGQRSSSRGSPMTACTTPARDPAHIATSIVSKLSACASQKPLSIAKATTKSTTVFVANRPNSRRAESSRRTVSSSSQRRTSPPNSRAPGPAAARSTIARITLAPAPSASDVTSEAAMAARTGDSKRSRTVSESPTQEVCNVVISTSVVLRNVKAANPVAPSSLAATSWSSRLLSAVTN